jgi:hypothetical protein
MAPLMGVHVGAMCKYETMGASPTSYGPFFSCKILLKHKVYRGTRSFINN